MIKICMGSHNLCIWWYFWFSTLSQNIYNVYKVPREALLKKHDYKMIKFILVWHVTLICLIKKINIRTQRAQKNASSKSIIKIPVKKKKELVTHVSKIQRRSNSPSHSANYLDCSRATKPPWVSIFSSL